MHDGADNSPTCVVASKWLQLFPSSCHFQSSNLIPEISQNLFMFIFDKARHLKKVMIGTIQYYEHLYRNIIRIKPLLKKEGMKKQKIKRTQNNCKYSKSIFFYRCSVQYTCMVAGIGATLASYLSYSLAAIILPVTTTRFDYGVLFERGYVAAAA